MAIAEAAYLMITALCEIASLVWMELAMFTVAAVVYLLAVGVPRFGKLRSKCADKATLQQSEDTMAKTMDSMKNNDLSSTLESMRKLGASTEDVIEKLRSALSSNPMLHADIEALLGGLLRDEAIELVSGIMTLLEQNGHRAGIALYAGLMTAQLRRRDFAGVAATAAHVPSQDLTPKMRATLATSAAHRRRLDEALGHLRQMSLPSDGSRCSLPPAAAAQILALAAQENRVASTTFELQRVSARLESKHLEELIAAASRRNAATVCRELIDASTSLQVTKTATMYQALASALTHDSDATGLEILVDELEVEFGKGLNNIAISEPLSIALLDGCKSMRCHDLVLRIVALHRATCAGAPGGHVLSHACSAFLTCDQPDIACDFYQKEMSPKNLWPDVLVAKSLIKAATAVGRDELAQCLSEHFKNQRNFGSSAAPSNGHTDVSRFATMIKAHARERDLASATSVFNNYRESSTPLSPLICNCYLDACVQCGDMEGAIAHFNEMKRLKSVDVVGYNTVIKAYLARGLTEEAHGLVRDMAGHGLHANKVTYNELLHAKVLAKDRKGLWSLIDEMHDVGVKANSVTCSILLKSLTIHSHVGDVRRVCDLIDEVEEPIDEVLFSSVIEACIRIKQLDLLSDLMRRYRKKGSFVNLTAPTYGSMIKAYGQAGDVVRVRELWHEMAERDVKPTAITLGCMAEALVANGEAEEAWDLIHTQLDSEDRSGCINTVIYSTVLKGFAVSRRMDKVFAVYKEMRGRNVPCNTITYNTMLDACAKCCAMDRASTLLEDMKESHVEPDIITYSTIIKGYCLEGDVDRAFSVLEEMKLDGKFSPDEIMYNSILDGCSKQHRVDDALRLLEEMKGAGVGPSNYTLSILVKLLGHARRLSQAFRMVEDLSAQNGFRPNVQVYTCLAQACILNRRLERALSLINMMAGDAGCVTDEKFYAVLARGCLQLHQPLKAVQVVREAYQLPGYTLETLSRSGAPVGVEMRALEELAGRLQAGGAEEQEALETLVTDLREVRGITIGDSSSTAGRSRGGNRRNQRGGGGVSRGKN